MDFEGNNYKKNDSVVERYRWMGWLYTIVGIVIMVMLMLMFLDMSNHTNFNRQLPESAPAVEISSPAITNFSD